MQEGQDRIPDYLNLVAVDPAYQQIHQCRGLPSVTLYFLVLCQENSVAECIARFLGCPFLVHLGLEESHLHQNFTEEFHMRPHIYDHAKKVCLEQSISIGPNLLVNPTEALSM